MTTLCEEEKKIEKCTFPLKVLFSSRLKSWCEKKRDSKFISIPCSKTLAQYLYLYSTHVKNSYWKIECKSNKLLSSTSKIQCRKYLILLSYLRMCFLMQLLQSFTFFLLLNNFWGFFFLNEKFSALMFKIRNLIWMWMQNHDAATQNALKSFLALNILSYKELDITFSLTSSM